MTQAFNKKTNPALNDTGAERATIAGILNHGVDGLIDIEEIVCTNDFYAEHHRKLFSVLRYMVHDRGAKGFDIPTIIATANQQGYGDLVGKGRDEEWLASLFGEKPTLDNTRALSLVVLKLSLARQAYLCVTNVGKQILQIKGTEDITQILETIENPIFDFTGKMLSTSSELIQIGKGYTEAMEALMAEPKDIAGLPTGFPIYDFAIGGGPRPGSVHVMAARPKVGKSFWVLNVAFNMAQAGIPTLILDTELPHTMQRIRMASLVSGVEATRIETGQFGGAPEERKMVLEAGKLIESLPVTYCSVAGQQLQSVLSIVRRWLVKTVGFGPNGTARPCVVFYDYLKLMDARDIKSNLAEYQLLGFLLTEMQNFALKYDIPFVVMAQQNRGGIENEASENIAGSDRILWLCSSLALLRKKTTEELNLDPASNGHRKIVVTDTRSGNGMEPGTYVNVHSDLARAKMKEGQTFSMAHAASVPTNKKKAAG